MGTRARTAAGVAGIVFLAAGTLAAREPAEVVRLDRVRTEIARLRREAQALEGRERGLLGEVARIDAAIALHRAEFEEAALRFATTEAALADHERELRRLAALQARRAPQLAAQLRGLYTRGPVGRLAMALSALQAADRLDGLRYAGFLARRDARQIVAWRVTASRVSAERASLHARQGDLAAATQAAGRSQASLESARGERQRKITMIRDDRGQFGRAIEELESAALELAGVAEGLIPGAATAAIDVRSFRGLLEWPADGPVSAGFGATIHPRFKTAVPHPGLDIDAPDQSPFRSVFDGRVAFAAQLHGYGLTVVVDHGDGVASVYAHASVLLVGAGDAVGSGDELGRVGESGSFRGPYLYFELRDRGKPVDPVTWLRRR